MPTPPVPQKLVKEMRRLRREGVSVRSIAKRMGVSVGTASNHTADIGSKETTAKRNAIEEAVRAGKTFDAIMEELNVGRPTIRRVIKDMRAESGPTPNPFDDDDGSLPEWPASDAKPLLHYVIDEPGTWAVIGDIHIPYHDIRTLNCFYKECRKRRLKGIILNGDTLDSHEVAFFDVERDVKTYKQELETCKSFLSVLRSKFTKHRIIWKDGNHEERVGRYCLRRAPAISDLPCVNLPAFLDMQKYGLEYVTDKRVIMLGSLPILHGHEYRGGVSTPVNAARGLFLKAKDSCMTNHFHQSSSHPETTIKDKEIMVWSVGCACGLQPRYNPHGGKWNHGFAFVDVDNDGDYSVTNLRVLRNGKVV